MAKVLIVLAVMAAFTIGTVALVRAIVHATLEQVRHVRAQADRQLANVRAWTAPPGPARELAGLRADLLGSLRSTTAALQAATATGRPMGDLPRMFVQLDAQGRRLEAELATLSRERETSRLLQALPSLRQRTRAIRAASDDIRWTVLDGNASYATDDTLDLTARIRDEASAVRAGAEAYRQAWPRRA